MEGEWLTQKAFSALYGIKVVTLGYWFARSKELEGNSFIPITSGSTRSSEPIEIIYPTDVRLRVEANLALIAQLIRLQPMFSLGSSHRFYLYNGYCDMRKNFDELCGLVIAVMGRQSTSGEVFVFLNRNRILSSYCTGNMVALYCITSG